MAHTRDHRESAYNKAAAPHKSTSQSTNILTSLNAVNPLHRLNIHHGGKSTHAGQNPGHVQNPDTVQRRDLCGRGRATRRRNRGQTPPGSDGHTRHPGSRNLQSEPHGLCSDERPLEERERSSAGRHFKNKAPAVCWLQGITKGSLREQRLVRSSFNQCI